MIQNDKIKTWRDEPITAAQLSAIINKSEKFGIRVTPVPKTKGEANEVMNRLDNIIAQKKLLSRGWDWADEEIK